MYDEKTDCIMYTMHTLYFNSCWVSSQTDHYRSNSFDDIDFCDEIL